MVRNISILLVVMLSGISFYVSAQSTVIDEVVAVLGDKKILYSDIEKSVFQLKEAGEKIDGTTRCNVLEQLLIQKLLLNQAQVDSIEVTESQVENELEMRVKYFVNLYGSQQKLENAFNKSVIEIKQDMRNEIRDMMLIREMRRKVTEGLTVTPSEVKSYYRNLHTDSIPNINAEVEYNQIFIYPKSSEQSKLAVREKLLGIRERIMNGESFATMAVINSEDGSGVRGGDIGWASKTDLDPEYAKAAFALKKGAVSRIVESSFGFHIIQCLDKTEDRINTRHILLRPKIDVFEKQAAISQLDSIIQLIRLDSMDFKTAAIRFSQDQDSRLNGGQAVNPFNGGVKWELDEFSPQEYEIINNMKIGEISSPYESFDKDGRAVLKAIWLKNRTNPHVGNLKEDYNLFKTRAMNIKENQKVNEWVEDKIKTTYIRLSEDYSKCNFITKGWPKI